MDKISNEERSRRKAAGLILVPFRCCCFDRELKRDGASWDHRVKAWLLPSEESYEKWVRRSTHDCFHAPSKLNTFSDPEDPYDRFASVLGKKLRRKL